MNYYVITPSNDVRGPFSSVMEAQENIPDSHGISLVDHVTDTKGCIANILSEFPALRSEAEMVHVETWVADCDADPDEAGYLVFSAKNDR